MDNKFQIDKKEVRVNILTSDSKKKDEEYIIFLNQFSKIKQGEETIEELLEGEKKFIPVKSDNTDGIIFVNLEDVIYIRESEKCELPRNLSQVVIVLENKIEIKVNHFTELPDFRSRIIDYLNTSARFAVFIDNSRYIYINKKRIIKVIK